jgi:hypothetical protein
LGRQAVLTGIVARGTRQPDKTILAVTREPPLGRPKWDSGISSSAQEWDAVLEVRPENRETFHGLAALLFAEGSESLNRAAVVRHPNLLLWCAATDTECPQGDR